VQARSDAVGDPVASLPFDVWVRRSDTGSAGCAIRFEVTEGKGVLRVARPGVLIVPPARVHGFEDHLTPDQLRSSQFLHIPRPGARRSTWTLSRIDDDSLALLDTDVWYALQPAAGGGALTLDSGDDGDVIALGGMSPDDTTETAPGPDDESAGDAEDVSDADSSLARVAGIVDVVTARPTTDDDLLDELLDEVIAVDPETVDSMLGPIILDDAELQRIRARASAASPTLSEAVEAPEPPPTVTRSDGRLAIRPVEPADDEGIDLPLHHPRLGVEGGRMLVRKLRFELQRRQLEITQLQEQVAGLQARLAQLEGDD